MHQTLAMQKGLFYTHRRRVAVNTRRLCTNPAPSCAAMARNAIDQELESLDLFRDLRENGRSRYDGLSSLSRQARDKL